MVGAKGEDQTTCLVYSFQKMGASETSSSMQLTATCFLNISSKRETLRTEVLMSIKHFRKSRRDAYITIYTRLIVTFGRGNATLPTYPRPRMQKALHRPCKRSAIYKTTLLCFCSRMSPLDEAKCPVCSHSFWITNPVTISRILD